MKKIVAFAAALMTVGISSVALAHDSAVTSNQELKCHSELKRADGSKVTAYFSEADCKKLEHAKKGETVVLAFFGLTDRNDNERVPNKK